MDCVILAGGKCDNELKSKYGCENKADLLFGEKRVIEIVEEAIVNTNISEKIICVGNQTKNSVSVKSGKSFLDSIKNGIEECNTEKILIITCDLPFLTPRAIMEFINKCDENACLNWPIIPLENCKNAFPNMRRTSLKLKEGAFTGGNAALILKSRFQKIFPVIEQAYAARKKPLKLASFIGMGFLFRVLISPVFPGQLSLRFIESTISKKLSDTVKAVITEDPSLGADVDNLLQYQQALEAYLKKPSNLNI